MKKTIGIIGGSQAYTLLKEKSLSGERLGERGTPFGNSQPIYKLKTSTQNTLYFLSRHGERKYWITAPFVNYRANIYALKDLGVEAIIAWTGPGAINMNYKIGDFVIIDDIIDETRSRASTFFENKGWGFIRMSEPFCPTLRKILKSTLTNLKLSFKDKGIYVCTQGPRLETRAEIRKYKSLGADLVGMTLAPEVFLAKELEMCYAALGYVTNYAEGISVGAGSPRPINQARSSPIKNVEGKPRSYNLDVGRKYKKGVLFEGMLSKEEAKKVDKMVYKFPEIIDYVARKINNYKFTCNCQYSMLRYKKRGDIGGDWRNWVK